MADKRISQLIERVDIANNDVLPIVASGATTTNKVTISTIQEWMQDNLDVGVTSVGITLGTTGTDVSVTGSPITTSGNITINIPDASATARGVVTTGSQTFGGVKTFADGLVLPSVGSPNQASRFVNTGAIHQGSAGSNIFGFNNSNNIYFGKGLSNGGVIQWNNAAVRYYTLQDADGTLAFTSQLDGYVTLNTAQTITAQKTFTTSGSSDTMIISHGSGSGFALDVIKAGSGEAIRVTKTSGSGNAMTITGGLLSAEAGLFSGDLQSNTRLAASTGGNSIIITPNVGSTNRIEAIGSLPLALVSANPSITMAAGGTTPQFTLGSSGLVTLTGALNGTSASFNLASTGSGAVLNIGNVGSGVFGGLAITDGGTYPMRVWGSELQFLTGSSVLGSATTRLTLASTGAATFSSSVFATSFNVGTGTFNFSSGDALLDYSSANVRLRTFKVGTGYITPLLIDSQTGAATFSSSVTAGGDVNITTGAYRSQGEIVLRRSGNEIRTGSGDGSDFLVYYAGATERMRITSAGNVNIGVDTSTSIGSWAALSIKLGTGGNTDAIAVRTGVNGNNTINWYNASGTYVSSVVINASSVAYNTSSDYRLKENVKPVENALSKLSELKPCTFNFIADAEEEVMGFIAHEVQEVIPQAVTGEKDGFKIEEVEVSPTELDEEGNIITEAVIEEKEIPVYQGIDHSKLVPLLVAAIQELKTEIDSLKNQIK